jgi:hypothetical protein
MLVFSTGIRSSARQCLLRVMSTVFRRDFELRPSLRREQTDFTATQEVVGARLPSATTPRQCKRRRLLVDKPSSHIRSTSARASRSHRAVGTMAASAACAGRRHLLCPVTLRRRRVHRDDGRKCGAKNSDVPRATLVEDTEALLRIRWHVGDEYRTPHKCRPRLLGWWLKARENPELSLRHRYLGHFVVEHPVAECAQPALFRVSEHSLRN